jgi:phospholipase C
MAIRKRPLLTVLIAGAVAALVFAAISRQLARVNQSIAAKLPGPIQHVVVIMQENRSFDHLFNGFPGADTVQSGMNHGIRVPLQPTPLGNGADIDHTHAGWWQQWDGGKVDNFANKGTTLPYSYIRPSETVSYWTLAKNFTLGDRMFQSNTGPSFVAQQYMIAGQSGKATTTSADPQPRPKSL